MRRRAGANPFALRRLQVGYRQRMSGRERVFRAEFEEREEV
jgi:hypothetical protein